MTFFAFVKLWHQQANIFFSIFKRRLVPLFFLKSFEKNEGRKTFYFRPSLLEEIEWSSLQNKQLIYVNQKKAKSFVVDRSKESMEMEFYAYPSRVFPLTPSFCSFCIRDLVDRAKDFISVAVSAIIGSVLSAVFTFFFALVGTLLGALTGALIGQETESGFVRGAAVGAISGAVFSLEVFESSLLLWQADESGITCLVYLIDVLTSLLSGRLVRERIGPAMLSAVQSQMGAVELAYDEVPNIFDTGVAKGLHGDSVEKIPKIVITKGNNLDGSGERVSCSVCLQDFQLGETVRCLPQCHHMFHLPCIDTWLLRHGSCPMCRRDL